jgi:glycosyltransferase involved in cell wall biosynthesis
MSAALDPKPGNMGEKRSHVAQLIETGGPGGAEHVLLSLAEALEGAADTRVTVGLLKEGWLAEEVRRRQLPLAVEPLGRTIDLGFLRALVRRFRGERVALVHAHEFTMNLYGAVAGRLVGVPVVATVHGRNYYPDALRRVWAMRLLPRLGAAVVAVSADIQGFLEELGVAPVRVIANGIDVDRYVAGDGRAARAALGIPAEAVVVGAVGNLYPVKGHATLIDAVARLDLPSVHIVIAGRGSEEEALEQQAGAAGLGDRLHLLGFRDDVPELLASFDIYALPSTSEGQSLALIEAMAASLPIVATRVGGTPEIVEHERSALLSTAGDAEELAAMLRRLIDDRALGHALAGAACRRACAEFSVTAMVRRYRQLYEELGLELLA